MGRALRMCGFVLAGLFVLVVVAVPLAVGDNYFGYQLVGTTTNLFENAEYAPGKKFTVQDGGRLFESGYREAVVGSFVAQKLKLKPGDKFHPFHGLIFDEKNQHSETYLVVTVIRCRHSKIRSRGEP